MDVDPDGVASLSSVSGRVFQGNRIRCEQNTAQDSWIRWRDTECDCRSRSKICWKFGHGCEFGKKKRIFEIAMKKVWDARSGPSFPDPTNLLLFFLSCALPFAVYCFGQFSVQNLCQTALELQSELSDCSCILSWSHSTIWHDILALTNLHGFTKNKISHQHKQATFLFLRVKTVFQLTSSFRPCSSFSKPGDWVWKCSNQKETEYFDIPTSNIGSAVKTRPPQLHHLFNFSSTLPFLAFNGPPRLCDIRVSSC